MALKKNNNRRTSALLALILAGEAIFFLPFVIPRVFRPTMLKVLDMTNFELGGYFSLYGIVAMLSYFLGGPLADRFASRKLMAIALWATALGGYFMVFWPGGAMAGPLYAFWGFTTIFLFWAALIRATREWGGEGRQGAAFGLLEGGRGLTAALIASFSLALFSWLMPTDVLDIADGERKVSFQWVILATSTVVFLTGWLVWFFVPDIRPGGGKTLRSSAKEIWVLITRPAIWMQGVMVVCAYVGYKITDDYSLYAHEVLGFSEVDAAAVGTAAIWLRPIFALAAGLLADRLDGVKVISGCFVLMFLGGTAIYMGVFVNAGMVLMMMATTLAGVYGIRGIYFAVMRQANISMSATGSAVGIISIVGFTPDVFMSPLMGYLLDTYPGVEGHQYVFLVLSVFALLGLLVSVGFRKLKV